MKISALFFLCVLLAGCANNFVEFMPISGRPIVLDIEIEAFSPPPPPSGKGAPAYAVTARILGERTNGPSKVRLVITD
ncbi:MAG: hypothetical protein LBM92_02595, partial [Opitutaceae bacterium]|nr:hypothetical protein [Opitutaceae bacterium]